MTRAHFRSRVADVVSLVGSISSWRDPAGGSGGFGGSGGPGGYCSAQPELIPFPRFLSVKASVQRSTVIQIV